MKLPDFEHLGISTTGVHRNPRLFKKSDYVAKSRWVNNYEFHFFMGDWEGEAMVNGTAYPIKDGYFLCCKPGQTKRLTMPYRCYNFQLAARDPRLKEALDALPTYAHHPEMSKITELCKKACHVDQRSTLNAKFESFSYATAILSLLLRQYADALVAANEGNVRRHQQALLDADAYLRTHLAEDIDLETLAKDSGLHPTYFQKLFTAAYGCSPAQRLTNLRINYARGLLHDDNRPISEIARMCGFSYQSYFSRVFKEIVKQTPSQYRQTLRKRRLSAKNTTANSRLSE